MPGMLVPGDVERIADYTGHPDREIFLLDHFVASEGALVARWEPRTGEIVKFRIPTITPRQQADGACVFLGTSGLCGIHPVAPYGCSHCDSHMPRQGRGQGDERVSAGLMAIAGDKQYQSDLRTLLSADKLAKPLAERRADYAAATDALQNTAVS